MSGPKRNIEILAMEEQIRRLTAENFKLRAANKKMCCRFPRRFEKSWLFNFAMMTIGTVIMVFIIEARPYYRQGITQIQIEPIVIQSINISAVDAGINVIEIDDMKQLGCRQIE